MPSLPLPEESEAVVPKPSSSFQWPTGSMEEVSTVKAFTVIDTVSVAVAPSLSVTVRVTVCAPTARVTVGGVRGSAKEGAG